MPATSAAAATSYNGSDYSYDYNTKQNLRTCDQESDSTPVKGRADDDGNLTTDQTILDSDGNNGVCASATITLYPGRIWHHSTCEAPRFRPDPCGNWVSTS